MGSFKKSVLSGLVLLGTGLCGIGVQANANEARLSTSLLDGMTIVYSYIDGNDTAYRVRFVDGLLDWEAISIDHTNGARSWTPTGAGVNGSPYKAHKLGNGEYILYFIESSPEGDLEWASLHIDFNTNRIFAASLFNYGENRADPHLIHWAPGFMYSVSRNN